MLDTLRDFKWPADSGPSVHEFRSPRASDAEVTAAKIRRISERLPLENVWVNPDCGLETCGYVTRLRKDDFGA